MISIELLLDPHTEARIRADWAALQQAGLSSAGAHRAISNRPHLTLLVRPALADVGFPVARTLLQTHVALIDTLVFEHGDRGVLAWRVELGEELQNMHRVVHEEAPPGEDAPHTAPGEWTPHITLARRLRLDAAEQARALLGPPLTGTGVALRRWDSETRSITW